MNIVIINRFPLNIIDYTLNNTDVNLYVFSSKQNSIKNEGNYKYIKEYDNYKESEDLTIDIMELSKEIKIDRIVALSEFDLYRAGWLREYLKIDGLKIYETNSFRDKIQMKDVLKNNGILTTDYEQLYSPLNFYDFYSRYKKVVIKPRRDAGSVGVQIIDSPDAFKNVINSDLFMNINMSNTYMVEEFVEGHMYHVDGIVVDGLIRNAVISKYVTPCIDFQNNTPLISKIVDDSFTHSDKMKDLVQKTLEALGGRETNLFHAEVFVNNNDELLINEIACRIGGAKIYSSLKLFNNTDLISEYMTTLINEKYISNTKQGKKHIGSILVPPKKGKIIVADDSFLYKNYIKELDNLIEDKYYSGASSSTDKILSVVIEADSDSQLDKYLDDFIKNCDKNIIYRK